MNKKLPYLFIILIVAQLLFYACCKYMIHEEYIRTMVVKNSDGENDLKDKSIIKQEDFRINCITFLELKSAWASTSFLINDAVATSCPPDEYKGIMNPVQEITIYCNKEIWGIHPLNSINVEDNIMVYYKVEEDSFSHEMPIKNWIQKFRNHSNPYYPYGRALDSYFVFKKKIESEEFLKFHFRIKLRDKSVINSWTNEVKIN
jgi:hypothetical protein